MKLLCGSEIGILLDRLSIEHDHVAKDWMEMLPRLNCLQFDEEKAYLQ